MSKLARTVLNNKLLRPITKRVAHFLNMATVDQGQATYAELQARARTFRLKRNEFKAEANALRPYKSAGQTALGRGTDSFAAFVMDKVRNFHNQATRMEARTMAQALADDPLTRELGHLACGVFFARDRFPHSAQAHFARLDQGLVLEQAAEHHFSSLIELDRDAGFAALDAHVAQKGESMALDDLFALVRLSVKKQRLGALGTIMAQIQHRREAGEICSQATATELDWLVSRLAEREAPTPALGDDVIRIGIMDYKMLHRAFSSSNHGDYVQSLAALSHVLRFQDVDFVGDDDLAEWMERSKSKIAPARRIEGVRAKVQPVAFDRDFSTGRSYGGETFVIANGWFMHRPYNGDFCFPFPDDITPIFVSFHVNKPELITDETAAYLKQHQPIGCRDWSTVYLLRDFGVDAFFSGCLTTTIGQMMPSPVPEAGQKTVAVVEADLEPDEYPGWVRETFKQVADDVRDRPLVESLDIAEGMLKEYLRFSGVATSRLHCYLPCASMGLDVLFRPWRDADVRFEGLLRLSPEAYADIRSRNETKMEAILRLILTGAGRADVRARWAELCAHDVAFADEYCRSDLVLAKPSFDIGSVAATLRSAQMRYGATFADDGAVHIAIAFDQNIQRHVPTVLASIEAHTDRPVVVHAMTRGISAETMAEISAVVPDLALVSYDLSGVNYGENIRTLKHITVSTMDRLMLPDMLNHLDKVLYLDVDLLVLDDIGDLFDINLGAAPLAGRPTRFLGWATCQILVNRATQTLAADDAWRVRRRLHSDGPLAVRGFNAGVVLMNLAQMRADDCAGLCVPLIETYHMNDQFALNVYARGRKVLLDDRWNYVPTQDFADDIGIVHWAGPVKPWGKTYVPLKNRFAEFEALVEARKAKG